MHCGKIPRGEWTETSKQNGQRQRCFSPIRRLFLYVGLCVIAASTDTSAIAEDRTFSGEGNNLANPRWGAAGEHLIRLGPASYTDGISAPAGADRPGARVISNAVFAQDRQITNARGLSGWVYQWGQFLDHDLDFTPNARPAEPFPISVPRGDTFFDALGTGTAVIGLNRSEYDLTTGSDPLNPREQINKITSYIDGSMVYGSDATRAAALRTGSGGRLKSSDSGLLPFNTLGLPNDTAGDPRSELFFVAGDVRANENISLTAAHTLFAREHNRLADALALNNPSWSDEQIYQRARKIVGAEIQAITFNEFLPALLGPYAPSAQGVYNPQVNASISNEFSTALYRMGHTMVNPRIARITDSGTYAPGGSLALRDSFFVPQSIANSQELEYLLKGLAFETQQETDAQIINAVRNFLLDDAPRGVRLDLASLNIQRGRDHGLPSYVEMRALLGLPAIDSFDDITSNASLAGAMAGQYGDVSKVDLYVGQLAEDHMPGASVGPTLAAGLVEQFSRLRDGDRFWFQFDDSFTEEEKYGLSQTRLSQIIMQNTGLRTIQPNVFFAAVPEPPLFAGMQGVFLGTGLALWVCARRWPRQKTV